MFYFKGDIDIHVNTEYIHTDLFVVPSVRGSHSLLHLLISPRLCNITLLDSTEILPVRLVFLPLGLM